MRSDTGKDMGTFPIKIGSVVSFATFLGLLSHCAARRIPNLVQDTTATFNTDLKCTKTASSFLLHCDFEFHRQVGTAGVELKMYVS